MGVILPALCSQAQMLDSVYSREKASVIRRSRIGRRKPSRKGLRDSLLRSCDESGMHFSSQFRLIKLFSFLVAQYQLI